MTIYVGTGWPLNLRFALPTTRHDTRRSGRPIECAPRKDATVHQMKVDLIRRALPSRSNLEIREFLGVVERRVAALHPEHVYVFGSHPRDEATPGSDIDLFLVVANSDQPTYRLAQNAYRAAGSYSLSLDIMVMSQTEFERRSSAAASLPAAVKRDGQLVYAA